ncbi:MAG: hypothetical protein U5J78_08105 [Parasphingorhabdus sp.]|nr:hypothetical protein [Parasphingorhabdus sp.]
MTAAGNGALDRNGAKTLAGAQYHAPIEGLVSEAAVTRLLATAGIDIAILKEASQAADFGGIALPLYADLSVETQVSYVRSHNVIGKIAGARPDSGAVLFLGHWDHLGLR